MSSLDQMSLLRGLSGQVAIASPLPSLAFHSSPLSPAQSSPDTESLSDSSSPANDSEEISLSFTPTNHQRLLHELTRQGSLSTGAIGSGSMSSMNTTSTMPTQQTVFGLDLPYSGHSYPYDIQAAANNSNATSAIGASLTNPAPASLIPNIPLLRNNSFGEHMALESNSLTALASSSATSSASTSAASITASLLASAAAHDLFSSLNLPNLSSAAPFNAHHLPTDSPLHLLGGDKKSGLGLGLGMDIQIPNIQNNKIDINQDSLSSSSSASSSSHKRSRNDRNGDVSSSKEKDKNNNDKEDSDDGSPGGEFDKKLEHRERHRLLDANRRSREAAAVLILQKYAYPDGSKDSSGKLIKNPDKVSVLQRSGSLLQQLTEQNTTFATQLHSTLVNQQQLKDEKEKMKTEMQQLRDRLASLEIERGDLRQRLQHAAQITNKMQERLVSVSNAAAAAAANATQTKLLPLISEFSGKDESQIASAAGSSTPPRVDQPVSLSMFNQNASMSLYESLFINSSIVMLAVNMQGILVAANKGMQRFLAGMSITYDEIIGRPICPFAARPGFAQLRQFLRMQQDREAARLKASDKDSASNEPTAEEANDHCSLQPKIDGEITFESTATGPLEDERNASPAPAYFARPYPHTAKSMAMLFSGKEQMVTSTHRWISKGGHTWEMQMTSYLVTENGMPSYCVGLTSDDHIVQIS